jgi:hypothetical protein
MLKLVCHACKASSVGIRTVLTTNKEWCGEKLRGAKSLRPIQNMGEGYYPRHAAVRRHDACTVGDVSQMSHDLTE